MVCFRPTFTTLVFAALVLGSPIVSLCYGDEHTSPLPISESPNNSNDGAIAENQSLAYRLSKQAMQTTPPKYVGFLDTIEKDLTASWPNKRDYYAATEYDIDRLIEIMDSPYAERLLWKSKKGRGLVAKLLNAPSFKSTFGGYILRSGHICEIIKHIPSTEINKGLAEAMLSFLKPDATDRYTNISDFEDTVEDIDSFMKRCVLGHINSGLTLGNIQLSKDIVPQRLSLITNLLANEDPDIALEARMALKRMGFVLYDGLPE